MATKSNTVPASRYNAVVAKAEETAEILRAKEKQFKDAEAHYKAIEKAARDLCKSILVKDRAEMTLGGNYSWENVPTKELLGKAITFLGKYNADRTDLLNRVMNLAEERLCTIDSLQDQISRMMIHGGMTQEEAQSEIDKEHAIGKADSATRNRASSGDIQLIVEEDKDVISEEMEAMTKWIDEADKSKISNVSIPIKESEDKKRQIKQKREEAMMAHMINLVEFEERCSTVMWSIVEVIGKKGISRYPSIEAAVLEMSTSDIRKTKVRSAATELQKMGIIHGDTLRLPLTPIVNVFRLSEIGSRLFKKKFQKDAVLSELEKVIAEHDNADHGYGIMDAAEMLTESGYYKVVNSFNRSRAISLKNGGSYIPDLIAIPKEGNFKQYIEYERGTHTKADFITKCNKMAQVTKHLDFIVPNSEVIEKKMIPLFNAWIESRTKEGLRGIKIRISAIRKLRGKNATKDDSWDVIYNLNKSAEPVHNTQQAGAEQ